MDPRKRELTLKNRGLDFEDAKQMWDGRPRYVTDVKVKTDRGIELRHINVGKIGEKVYTVVTTVRKRVVRIFSFHRTDNKGVRLYEQYVRDNHG